MQFESGTVPLLRTAASCAVAATPLAATRFTEHSSRPRPSPLPAVLEICRGPGGDGGAQGVTMITHDTVIILRYVATCIGLRFRTGNHRRPIRGVTGLRRGCRPKEGTCTGPLEQWVV